MTGGKIITNLLDRKQGGPCQICSEVHIPQNRCRFEALASKITKLMEANSFIPQILAANKEATTLAQHYQQMLKQADVAMTVVQEVLMGAGPEGEKLLNEILARIDEWAAATAKEKSENTSQDTGAKQLELFSQEPSTPKETSDKPSTTQNSGSDSPLIL